MSAEGKHQFTRRSLLENAAALGAAAALPEAEALAADACPNPANAYDRGHPLTHQEWRALTLVAQVLLPRPLPANGPSLPEVVANLQRFVVNADPDTLASLRRSLGLLGVFGGLALGNLEALTRDLEAQLMQRDFTPIKAAIDQLHKVIVLGYYSLPKAGDLVGYTRPDIVPLKRTCLATRARPTTRLFDVAIVGAGVAGSLLAERLTKKGKSVLLLDAGPYVPEMTIDADELLWIARLQKGSGLQNANEVGAPPGLPAFPVLQGACVGGGGMINNAICFQMPDARLRSWHDVGFPIPSARMRAAYQAVAQEIRIVPVSQATRFLNPSLTFLEDAFGTPKIPSVTEPPGPGFWECLVNIAESGCLGCGLCNTGCGSERKRNALQVHLPAALGPGRDCELVPSAQVQEIVLQRRAYGVPPRVAELVVRMGSETVRVRAREYVLSAGAIHTTALLLRSPDVMASAASLPLGARFFANVASPVLGFYRQEVIHPRTELQLTHYYFPEDPKDAFLIEDLYNPPGQAALVIPGYGQTHATRMAMYRSTTLTGAVVPTSSLGRVSLGQGGRPAISLPLSEELPRFKKAIGILARAMLAPRKNGDPSPLVIAGSNAGGLEMRSEADVQRFERWFTSFDQVALSTGHPQGGSALSVDPTIGVVGPDFKVRGFDNLRVCDGSLFPSAAGVNPQWTIMALAHLCSEAMTA